MLFLQTSSCLRSSTVISLVLSRSRQGSSTLWKRQQNSVIDPHLHLCLFSTPLLLVSCRWRVPRILILILLQKTKSSMISYKSSILYGNEDDTDSLCLNMNLHIGTSFEPSLCCWKVSWTQLTLQWFYFGFCQNQNKIWYTVFGQVLFFISDMVES